MEFRDEEEERYVYIERMHIVMLYHAFLNSRDLGNWYFVVFAEECVLICVQAAGTIGGAASSLVRVPTEVVKQRIQTGQFKSTPAAVRLIIANEGFKGLYAVCINFMS
ncbi:S-adenosylmethionine carrier 1, chloroplastic/mitochondrial [Trifolium repens]|nr:S-adenosylmethionine carrier 1, chloroplastic/mitochondrial [Trifolium repens]